MVFCKNAGMEFIGSFQLSLMTHYNSASPTHIHRPDKMKNKVKGQAWGHHGEKKH